jgi:3-hydroxypropanoate dehydrogenase
MMTAPLSPEALDQLFSAAHTCYAYKDIPVSTEQLHAIWDQMKYGPTSFNCLPARMIWCVSAEAKEKLAALSMDANAKRIREAPATVIIGMDTAFYEKLPELFPPADVQGLFSGNAELAQTTAFRNSTLQGGYLILAARALGLGVGPMSGFNNAAVDEAFFAGTTIKSNFIATLGVPDPAGILPRLPRPEFARFNSIA